MSNTPPSEKPKSTHCDLIIHARWIIPVIPAGKTFSHCSVIIHQGLIRAIIPSEEARRRYRAKDEIDLQTHILLPGLINAHGHAAMSLLRGYADDLPLQTWLSEHIWPAEAKQISAPFVYEGSQLAIAEMIRSGTTCFADMYFFPEQLAQAASEAGIRTHIYFPILEFANAWAATADEAITQGLRLRDQYSGNDLVTVGFGPHAPYTVSDKTFERIAVLASELQAGIQVHLHETQQEVEQALKETGKRPLQRLAEHNLLSPLTQCVHMTALNNDDRQLLQASGAHVIHCPESNLKLASGFCPVNQLLKAGINVALGTDGCASNNNLDMFGEMHTAALLAKAVTGDAAAVDAHQALAMATINGAKALGIDSLTGSLEVGKSADIIAVKLDPLEQAPLYQAASQLVYTHNGHRVSHSWVQGQALMHNRQLTRLKESTIIANSQKWQTLIRRKD
ncbi:MAG: TRZ/ATZ family hydrolase [Cellvibrionaceae bacterium]|nr:TRZ/ATZ family hydrolase [Cellvibrionaceae bacterium]